MAKFAIPGAIVVAGLLIVGAVYISSKAPAGPSQQEANLEVVLPVTEDDQIMGSPNAKITIIEYSDIDCPFCKQFHETMKQVIETYGPTEEVAWVYRHFPLTNNHPNAKRHAVAAECVGTLKGDAAFFDFVDLLIQSAPGNAQADPKQYGAFASQLGVSEENLNACIQEGVAETHVENEFNTAIEAGGNGTPFNIIVVEGQEPVAFSAALPFDQMQQVIEQILAATQEAS